MLRPYFDEVKDRDWLNKYYFETFVLNHWLRFPAPPKRGRRQRWRGYIPAQDANFLRLASYNIHYHQPYTTADRREKAEYNRDIRKAIERLDPDVLVIQEAQEPHTVLPPKKYPYVKYYEAEGRWWQMGNAICSKYPLSDVRCVTFETQEHLQKVDTRCFISATVEPREGVALRVIGTHLDVSDETEATRLTQVEQLHAEAQLSTLDNICCVGDFNALYREDYDDHQWEFIQRQDASRNVVPQVRAMNRLINDFGWRDAFRESTLVQGRARNSIHRHFNVSTWSLRRIDYTLLSPRFNLRIADSMVLYTPASDHVPIAIDIDLRNR